MRSKEKADALAAMGVRPLLGSLRNLQVIQEGAGDARHVAAPKKLGDWKFAVDDTPQAKKAPKAKPEA